jgi:hypothetical protein
VDPLAVTTIEIPSRVDTVDSGDAVDAYGCVLEQQPTHLVPTRLLDGLNARARATPGEDWFLAPGVALGEPHPSLTAWGAIPDAVHHDPWTLWVTDPGPGTTVPYLLGEEAARAITTVLTGEPLPSLSRSTAFLLRAVGALVTQCRIDDDRAEWAMTVTSAVDTFERGYASLAGLVHPFHLACLRARYRRLIRRGRFALGDAQSARRYVAHNEPAARFFHRQLTPVVAQVARTSVRPSYVYLAAYQPGADLPPHVDRAQCEYTLALCVDFTPEPRCETSWPLKLQLPDARLTVYQALGDALLYRGRTIPHSRESLPSRSTSTSLFFHYVDEGFEGPLD